jgi:hypothetical protein
MPAAGTRGATPRPEHRSKNDRPSQELPGNKPAGQAMKCVRCDGLMTAVTMQETATGDSAFAFRCLLCGEVIDSIIAANRQGHRPPVKNRARLPIASY